jgi:hypothetical protein
MLILTSPILIRRTGARAMRAYHFQALRGEKIPPVRAQSTRC